MMPESYPRVPKSVDRQPPSTQYDRSHTRARFSFIPATSEQLERGEFQPSSPTNSDIETSTISSFSPGLAPVSRSISMIVEQQKRQERGQRAQQLATQYQPINLTSAPQNGYIPGDSWTTSNKHALAPQHRQIQAEPPLEQSNYNSSLRDRHVQSSPATADQNRVRPQLSLDTQKQYTSTDRKDPATLVPPYYMRPPTEPHPRNAAPTAAVQLSIPQPTEQRLGPTSTLFPAYRTQGPTLAQISLAGPDVIPVTPSLETAQKSFHLNKTWLSGFWANSACCLALPCPCIVYGKTQYRLSQKSAGKPATDLIGYSTTNGSCLMMGLACCFSGAFAFVQRSRVRSAYNLEGSVADDLLKSCCCCCCVIAQDESEIAKREDTSLKGSQMSYISPMGMAYPPPPRG